MTDMLQNGAQTDVDPRVDSAPVLPQQRLQPGTLRRLRLAQAGVEGATEAAQAAITIHAQRQAAYRQSFEAACEDAGIVIPAGDNDVQIDWNTGEVRFIRK